MIECKNCQAWKKVVGSDGKDVLAVRHDEHGKPLMKDGEPVYVMAKGKTIKFGTCCAAPPVAFPDPQRRARTVWPGTWENEGCMTGKPKKRGAK
jgi:hypothetical protein